MSGSYFFDGYVNGIEDAIASVKVRYNVMQEYNYLHTEDEIRAVEEVIRFLYKWYNSVLPTKEDN